MVRVWVFAGLVVAVSACGDSTGPAAASSIDVLVTVTQVLGPNFSTDADSAPKIDCGLDVQAVARGSGKATWQDATVRFYAGQDRSHTVDSASVTASDVQSSWGDAEISAGQTRTSTWTFTAGLPFGVAIEYRYRPAGTGPVKSSTVSFTCSPTVPANAPPPVVSAVTARDVPSGGLQPGETLVLEYSAASQAGLWATVVLLSGPCDMHRVFAEHLQPSVTRTVRLLLPVDCKLGVPLHVTVAAFDAALQEDGRDLGTAISLVDRTPPGLELTLFSPTQGRFQPGDGFEGDYFVGDTIFFMFGAWDNYALRALVWEVWPAGFRDSVITTGTSAGPFIKVPVRSEWVGPIQLRFYVRDAAGLTSDTLKSTPDSLRVSPTIQRPTVETTLSSQLMNLEIDAKRGVLYVVPSWGENLIVLSASTLAASSPISIPTRPWSLELSTSGDSLLMTFPSLHALGIVDLRQASPSAVLIPVTSLDTTLGQRLGQLRVAVNGKALLPLEGMTSAAYTLLEVDLRTGAQHIRTDAGDNGWVGGVALARSFDHATMVLMSGPALSMQRYDAATDAFGPHLSARSPWAPSVDGTGQRINVGLDIYDGSLQFLRRVRSAVGDGVPARALSVDGAYLYQGIRGMVRARVSDGLLQDRSPAPFVPDLIRVSADGTLLAMMNGVSGRICVMDLR